MTEESLSIQNGFLLAAGTGTSIRLSSIIRVRVSGTSVDVFFQGGSSSSFNFLNAVQVYVSDPAYIEAEETAKRIALWISDAVQLDASWDQRTITITGTITGAYRWSDLLSIYNRGTKTILRFSNEFSVEISSATHEACQKELKDLTKKWRDWRGGVSLPRPPRQDART